MNEIITDWKDEYHASKNRHVFSQEQLDIPGVRSFGKYTMQNASPPLSPHFHENSFEFTYATKGSISYFIQDREYKLNGGDIFLSYPNEVHSTNGFATSSYFSAVFRHYTTYTPTEFRKKHLMTSSD